jgi:hypothetical protein
MSRLAMTTLIFSEGLILKSQSICQEQNKNETSSVFFRVAVD